MDLALHSPLTNLSSTYEHLRQPGRDFDIYYTSPSELFSLASALASAGDIAAKRTIYQWIRTHPHSTPADLLRVKINDYDRIRRDGYGEKSLDGLLQLPIQECEDLTVTVEYLQAIGQCHILLFHELGETDHLDRALNYQQQLLKIATDGFSIPDDKYLYYLETLIYFQIEEFKSKDKLGIDNAELERDIEQNLNHYQEKHKNSELTESHNARAHRLFALLRSEFYKCVGDFCKVQEASADMMSLTDPLTQAEDYANPVVNYLYATIKAGLPQSGEDWDRAYEFYIDIAKYMQATEFPRYQSELQVIDETLGTNVWEKFMQKQSS